MDTTSSYAPILSREVPINNSKKELALVYDAIRKKFIHGDYLCALKEAASIAAWQCRVDWGAYREDVHSLELISAKDCLPAPLLVDTTSQVETIFRAYSALPADGQIDARSKYISEVKELAGYKAEVFPLTGVDSGQHNPNGDSDWKRYGALRLGIGVNGFVLVSAIGVVVTEWRYEDVQCLSEERDTTLALYTRNSEVYSFTLKDARDALHTFAALAQDFQPITETSNGVAGALTTVTLRVSPRKGDPNATNYGRTDDPSDRKNKGQLNNIDLLPQPGRPPTSSLPVPPNAAQPLKFTGATLSSLSQQSTGDTASTTSSGKVSSKFGPRSKATVVSEYNPNKILDESSVNGPAVVRILKYKIGRFSPDDTTLPSSRFITVHDPSHITVIESCTPSAQGSSDVHPALTKRALMCDQAMMHPAKNLLAVRVKAHIQLYDLQRKRRGSMKELRPSGGSSEMSSDFYSEDKGRVYWRWLPVRDGNGISEVLAIVACGTVWHWRVLGTQASRQPIEQFKLPDYFRAPDICVTSYDVDSPRDPRWALVVARSIQNPCSGRLQLYNYEKLAIRDLDGQFGTFIILGDAPISGKQAESSTSTMLALVNRTGGKTQLLVTPCGPSSRAPQRLELMVDSSDHIVSLIPSHALGLLWILSADGWIHVVDARTAALLVRTHHFTQSGIALACSERIVGGCTLVDNEGVVMTLGARAGLMEQLVGGRETWKGFLNSGGISATGQSGSQGMDRNGVSRIGKEKSAKIVVVSTASSRTVRPDEPAVHNTQSTGNPVRENVTPADVDIAEIESWGPEDTVKYFDAKIGRRLWAEAAEISFKSQQPAVQSTFAIDRITALCPYLDAREVASGTPVLAYLTALINLRPLDERESEEYLALSLASNREFDILQNLKKGRIEAGESLADYLAKKILPAEGSKSVVVDDKKSVVSQQVVRIYKTLGLHAKCLSFLTRMRMYDTLISYLGETGFQPVFEIPTQSNTLSTPSPILTAIEILEILLSKSRDCAVEFSLRLSCVSSGDVQAMDFVVDMFMERELVKQVTDFLLEALKRDRIEEADLQTRLIMINLEYYPEVADALLRSDHLFSYYDRPQIAERCWRTGLISRAVDLYAQNEDWDKMIVMISMLSKLSDKEILKLLHQLLNKCGSEGQPTRTVMNALVNHGDRCRGLVVTALVKFRKVEGSLQLVEWLATSEDAFSRLAAWEYLQKVVDERSTWDEFELLVDTTGSICQESALQDKYRLDAPQKIVDLLDAFIFEKGKANEMPGGLFSGYIGLAVCIAKDNQVAALCASHPNLDLPSLERRLYAIINGKSSGDSSFDSSVGNVNVDDAESVALAIDCLCAACSRSDGTDGYGEGGANLIRCLLARADLRRAGDFLCLLKDPKQVIPIFEVLLASTSDPSEDDPGTPTQPQLRYLIAAMDARGPIGKQLDKLLRSQSLGQRIETRRAREAKEQVQVTTESVLTNARNSLIVGGSGTEIPSSRNENDQVEFGILLDKVSNTSCPAVDLFALGTHLIQARDSAKWMRAVRQLPSEVLEALAEYLLQLNSDNSSPSFGNEEITGFLGALLKSKQRRALIRILEDILVKKPRIAFVDNKLLQTTLLLMIVLELPKPDGPQAAPDRRFCDLAEILKSYDAKEVSRVATRTGRFEEAIFILTLNQHHVEVVRLLVSPPRAGNSNLTPREPDVPRAAAYAGEINMPELWAAIGKALARNNI